MRWLLVGLVLVFPALAQAELYVRYDTDSKDVTDVSTVPFTTPPKAREAELRLDVDTLPEAVTLLKVSDDEQMVEPDPVKVAQRQADIAAAQVIEDEAQTDHKSLTVEQRLDRLERRAGVK